MAVVVQAVTHMAQNVFPATRRTWICEALDEGPRGRAAVNLYLMQVYARPLEVYLRGSGYRTAGDPTDLVQGFLADRLARPGFLADWHHSGKPLRRWLANGLLLFVREELRRNQPAASGSEALATVPAPGDDPAERLEREFDQSFVISLVRRALAVTEQRCRSRNLVRHWQSFLLHHYYGMAFDEVAKKLGIPAQEAKETARAPRGRFRAALRELLGNRERYKVLSREGHARAARELEGLTVEPFERYLQQLEPAIAEGPEAKPSTGPLSTLSPEKRALLLRRLKKK